jgi:signal transduction histidine kinase
MDRLTLGARQQFESFGVPCPSGDRATIERWGSLGGWSIDLALRQLARRDLLQLAATSLVCCPVPESDVDAWQRAEQRSLAIAERAVQIVQTDNSGRASDAAWWALYLTSPVGILDERHSCWRLEHSMAPLVNSPVDLPLVPCLDCVRRAAATVDSLDELPGEAASATSNSTDEAHSWANLLPGVLALANRCGQLEDEFQQTLQREKLLALKELAYGASHEINNPLANISSRAQLLLRDETDPERRRTLATINSQAFRAHEMIADMMLFAKPPALQCQTIALGEFLDQLLNQLAAELADSVILERHLALGDCRSSCDPVQLAVAVRAIWSNALEAMGHAGKLRVVARRVVAADGSPWARLETADSGPGIAPEVRRHLFDPFFSGREAGRGLGFGLSKAWRIVDLHGGRITVDSEPGQGAVMGIELPLSDSSRLTP